VPRIVFHPHPALRYTSRPVARIDDDLRAAVRAMFDLMYEARGIGLAANQVALPYRFFILNLTADPDQPDQEQVFINPEIVKRHSSVEDEEGCLSLPGIYAKVRRARKIRVKAYDLAGHEVDLEAEDLLGRAIQHEADHLNGKLFLDYLTPAAASAIAVRLKDLESDHRRALATGQVPDDATLVRDLDAMPAPAFDAEELAAIAAEVREAVAASVAESNESVPRPERSEV